MVINSPLILLIPDTCKQIDSQSSSAGYRSPWFIAQRWSNDSISKGHRFIQVYPVHLIGSMGTFGTALPLPFGRYHTQNICALASPWNWSEKFEIRVWIKTLLHYSSAQIFSHVRTFKLQPPKTMVAAPSRASSVLPCAVVLRGRRTRWCECLWWLVDPKGIWKSDSTI